MASTRHPKAKRTQNPEVVQSGGGERIDWTILVRVTIEVCPRYLESRKETGNLERRVAGGWGI